jgi:predicted nuclease of restriction endonuclease-like RecB superfamily
MTVIEFVRRWLPNYQERKNNLYRVHKNKNILQWHNDKFPEAYLNFENSNNIKIKNNG